LVGLFDWDVVCAGSPTWDLAFLAWHWVPLYKPSPAIAWRTDDECGRRLRRIVDSFALKDRSDFLEQIIGRMEASQVGIKSRAANGDEVFKRLQQEGHIDEMQHAIDYVRVNETFLKQALSD
jgi:thiamine kinase-like enzyme